MPIAGGVTEVGVVPLRVGRTRGVCVAVLQALFSVASAGRDAFESRLNVPALFPIALARREAVESLVVVVVPRRVGRTRNV